MIIPAEININDCNTCQYAIWHELKICALIEKTGISMYGYRLAQYIRRHDRPLVRHAGLQK